MPVEIRELVIRAVAQSEGSRPAAAGHGERTPEAQQELIDAAVREVLRILKAKGER